MNTYTKPDLSQATARPWRVEKRGHLSDVWAEGFGTVCVFDAPEVNFISTATANANARLIVTAVNSFDALREALQNILPLAEQYLWNAPSHPDNAKLEDARAALKLAQGD